MRAGFADDPLVEQDSGTRDAPAPRPDAADATPGLVDSAPLDAPPDDAAPDAGAPGKAGSLQNAGAGPTFRLLLAMADNTLPNSGDFIKELTFNAAADSVVNKSSVKTNPGQLKAMDVDIKGRLLLAHYRKSPFTLDLVEVTPALKLAGALSLSHAADPSRALDETHALCFLPGGNLLLADGSNTDNNHFNEYDAGGNLLRGVLTSKQATSGAARIIAACISRSDTEVYALETEIAAHDGRMLRITRPGASAGWIVTDSVKVDDVATKLGAAATRSFTFALDQKNERLYVAPFMPTTSTLKNLIRCPAKGFSAASCSAVGAALPGANSPGGSVVKSLVQIPGTDDLLMLNHGQPGAAESRKLYRYNAASGAWKQLFDLKQIVGGYAQPQGYPVLL